jgi:hypothetical protein
VRIALDSSPAAFWFTLGVVVKMAVLMAWHVSRQSLALQLFFSMDPLGNWIAGVISRLSGDGRSIAPTHLQDCVFQATSVFAFGLECGIIAAIVAWTAKRRRSREAK